MHFVWNVVYTFRISVHRDESFSKRAKRIPMKQYENGLRKDSFVNRTQSTMLSCNFWIHTPSGTESYGRCQAGVKQNFGESHVSKKLANYSTFHFVLLRLAITMAILRDSGCFFRMKSTVRLFFEVQNFKNVSYF